MTAFISGKPADLDTALDRAGQILGAAKLPVVSGAGADVAGARSAIGLAQALGGVYDPHAAVSLEARAFQRQRLMFTTPREAKARADAVLIIGEEAARYAAREFAGKTGPLIAMGAGRVAATGAKVLDVTGERLPGAIAALCALVKGAPIAAQSLPVAVAALRETAETLKAARFGVAVWSPSELDPLATDALMLLAAALNASTRFSTLMLAGGDNARGMAETAVWLTGFSGRISFAQGEAEYDPWRCDAQRMVNAGECDAAVWVSAFRAAGPPWTGSPPLIALTGPGAAFPRPPEVHFNIGKPGADHPGECYDQAADALISVAAPETGKLRAAAVLDAIRLRVERRRA
jgi:formylmethanofuran dehydrogenase subunit B